MRGPGPDGPEAANTWLAAGKVTWSGCSEPATGVRRTDCSIPRAAARSPLFVAVGQRKTRAIPFKPCGSVRVVEVRAGHRPPAPDHPGFPLLPCGLLLLGSASA